MRKRRLIGLLCLAASACPGGDALESGWSHLATLPPAQGATTDVQAWEIYEADTAIRALGIDADGLAALQLVAALDPDGSVTVQATTAGDGTVLRLDQDGRVLDFQPPLDPALLAREVQGAVAALEEADQGEAAAGAISVRKGATIGTLALCGVGVVATVVGIVQLGLNPVVDYAAIGGLGGCAAGILVIAGYVLGRRDGHLDGSRSSGGFPMRPGQWRAVPGTLSTPHPLGPADLSRSWFLECPAGATFTRPRFGRIDLGTLGKVKAETWIVGRGWMAAALAEGGDAAPVVPGARIRLTPFLGVHRDEPFYGFDVVGMDCFFEEGVVW